MDTGTIISVAALVTTLINTSTSGNLLSVAIRPFKWLTEKTKNFLFNFMKKMESEDINVTILTDEKRIKIFNILTNLIQDEDKMEKETGYLYDIKKTIEDKNYIPIFDKLTLEDLEKFKDLGNTIYDIINTSEVWIFFISNFSGYVPATLISNINNNSISISDIFPVTLEKYAKYKFEKELFSSPIFPFSELIFNNLKIKNWFELEFLYRKFEKYELILTSHQTMQRLPHGGKILQPTIYSMLIKLENKGQEILKILNS